MKPDPNDTLNRSLNGGIGSNANNFYYDTNNYKKLSDEMNSMYINGQAKQQGTSIHQDPLQHQYAVVKKTGSKRDIRENLERENSAIFKVNFAQLSILALSLLLDGLIRLNLHKCIWD